MRLVPTITGCVTSTAAAIACPGIQDPTSGGLATSILLGEAGIAADTPAIAQDATGDTSVVSIRDTGAMNEFQNSRGSALWTEQQLLGVNGAKGSPTARALDDGTVSFAYARGEGGLSIGVLRDGVLENTMRLPVTVVTSGCVRSLNFPERYWFTTALNGELIILRMSSTPRWVTTDGATKATGCIAPVFFGGVSWVNANASGALIIQPLVEFTGIGSLAGTQRSATQLAADGGSNGCPAASGREDQGLDIASISQAGVLTYYANTPPATTFTSAEIDIKKKFIGCPSMIERSDKSIVLAVAASDGSLWLYAKAPGSPTWTSRRLTRAGASNGKLVMIERPDHELNIVSATPNMSLRFFAFD
jgi:hypothetical protein